MIQQTGAPTPMMGYTGPYGGPQWNQQQYGWNMQQPVAKQMNFLTNEEIAQLVKKQGQFALGLTNEDKLKAKCNHRNAEGTGDTLKDNPDGTCTCGICGYTFKPVDAHLVTKESIQGSVDDVVDVLQTIKMIYYDLSSSAASEYMQIIPLIEKIPALFEYAVDNFSKHENPNMYNFNGRNLGTVQAFQMLSSLINGYQAPPQQGQPQPNAYYNPGFAGYNPQMGMGPSNGFGYMGASDPNAAGYQPTTTGFQYNAQPQQAPPPFENPQPQVAPQPIPQPGPVDPSQPVAQTTTADGQNVQVAAEFKA